MNPKTLSYFAIEVPSERADLVYIRQRNARISAGSRAVLFIRGRHGVEFIRTADIENVTVSEENSFTGPMLKLRHRDTFLQSRTLAELAGSLAKIKDPLRAGWTFGRQYVRLDYFDYERIRIRRVDVPRTVFRTLYFTLPIALRVEFLQEVKDAFEQGDFPVVDHYDKLADRILEYVRQPVALVLKMGDDFYELYSELSVPNLPSIETLTMTNAFGERAASVGRASLAIHREDLVQSEDVFDDVAHLPETKEERETWALPLGLPEHVEELRRACPPDLKVEHAEESLRRLEARPWQEWIL